LLTLGATERWLRTIAGVALLATACEDAPTQSGKQGGGESGAGGDSASGMGDAGGPDEGSEPPRAAKHVALFDSFAAEALSDGFAGQGGAAPELPSGPPYGTSITCGDAIVGDNEECDDGAGGADACTALCETRDMPAGPEPGVGQSSDRYLGAGRHPVSGLDRGFITTYVQAGGDEPGIAATLFNIWGQPTHYVAVSEGASPIYEANPVAAALPDGSYAVAWSDFDGDGSDLGIALRRVERDGELGSLLVANHLAEFSQLNPDMIWTGNELLVAWEDYADPFNGPDLRYRTFDQDLNPTSGELDLAIGQLPEAAVALAPFNGGWAAAYREGAVDGGETIVVKVGDESFRVGPFYGGPLDDRPALIELDATHLLLVFSAGTDPRATGVNNVPRLRYSVIDVESAAMPTFAALDPLDDVFTQEAAQSHLSPAVAPGLDGVYIAWRSEGRPSDAAGDQVWIKFARWDANPTQQLELDEVELLAPRVCEGSFGDQRRPALAPVALPRDGALAIAWDDYSRSQGATSGAPDVVVHYAPTHVRGAEAAALQVFQRALGKAGRRVAVERTLDLGIDGKLRSHDSARSGADLVDWRHAGPCL
jgi:hypothetical protein